jgi:hypothetical protein
VFQWQNSYGINLGKKQAGYGMQSHTSAAEMDVAQPLSTDAKVHIYNVTISPDTYYVTISVAGKVNLHCIKTFISTQ